jgi:hypothetical protein
VDTADGSRLLLRLHRAEVTGVDQIAAELAWLDALARDTALPVPSTGCYTATCTTRTSSSPPAAGWRRSTANDLAALRAFLA